MATQVPDTVEGLLWHLVLFGLGGVLAQGQHRAHPMLLGVVPGLTSFPDLWAPPGRGGPAPTPRLYPP